MADPTAKRRIRGDEWQAPVETEAQSASVFRSEPEPVDPQQAQRIRAAWIYYIEGRTQNEVAEILGLSRVAVTRMLSEARRRGEVNIRVPHPIADLVKLERTLETDFQLAEAVVAPLSSAEVDPTAVIAAAAGNYVSELMDSNMTVGVGWGRTMHASLPHIRGRSLNGVRVVSLLGGIAQAKRFNPAEFAWQFAEIFDAEGFLVSGPALVDSPQTKHALLEHCGLDQIFEMAASCDVAIFSAGGISNLTTSYRFGHVSAAERLSLIEKGAVGDILYNFVDADGAIVDHDVNARALSLSLDQLSRIPRRVLISGGKEKVAVLKAALTTIRPTTLITDERTARALNGSD